MTEKVGYNTAQLFNFSQDSYLERTSRPIYGLFFLVPFLVFYELGTILTHTDALSRAQDRVVAFVWLQSFLDTYLGLGGKFAWIAPPLVVVVILLALQLASRKSWNLSIRDTGPMAMECVLLAVPLIVLSLFLSGPVARSSDMAQGACREVQMYTVVMSEGNPETDNSAAAEKPDDRISKESFLADIVTGIGAGIYEELIFRLILMCILMVLLQDIIGMTHANAIVLSVLISAALFSAHHHVVFVNGRLTSASAFNWTEFSFRTMAGVYFAVLFAIRGFGITAGTHAFYDIIATVINIAFFQH
jgi:hypothetical protein